MLLADLIISGCKQLVTCRGPAPKRKTALQDAGVLEKACIASKKRKIVFIGTEEEMKQEVDLESGGKILDAKGLIGLPGLVDPHTHLPFAGSREQEFRLRINGWTYQELAQKGMGIQSTVNATRKITSEKLLSLCLRRLDNMLLYGTTTAEAKSGYGLNLKDEVKQLRVLKEANQIHPVDIVPTFMGAHEIPKEYKTKKKDYMNLLTRTILPEIMSQNLAEFFDIFCEQGVYSLEETQELIKAAKKFGLKIKIHADEFTPLGGAQLAVEEKAISAEHLIAITPEGIQKLAASPTAAVLLPGVPFFLMQRTTAPARKLIDAGAVVALGTDFNPGSSMTESQVFIMQLGVFTLKMTIEEAINAATINAAYSIDRHNEIGSLEVGKNMDMILCDGPNFLFLIYHLGKNPITHVIKNGKIVVQDRQRTQTT